MPLHRPIKARGFIDFSKGNKKILRKFIKIKLFLVTHIREKKKSFQLCTQFRNWKFKCKTEQEREEWVAAVYSVATHLTSAS